MVTIDRDACIGCGKCVKDCFPQEIVIEDGKARLLGRFCIECGHCYAVCPVNAVNMEGYEDEKNYPIADLDWKMDPDKYLNFIRVTRTVRQFKKDKVSREDIVKMLDAARYSPTGGNLQDVRYIVFQDETDQLRRKSIERLYELADPILANPDDPGRNLKKYAMLWEEMYEKYNKTGEDRLFYGGNTVICTVTTNPTPGILTAVRIEEMAYALGLGVCYCGFLGRAVNDSQELREFAGLKPGEQLTACIVVGKPDIEYMRTVPRKAAVVDWK